MAAVLNSQLIPAIVLLNYGKLDVPMPELRFKIPQAGVTLERVQVVKTALEIKGMKLKKSEVYEFTGFAGEGEEVTASSSNNDSRSRKEPIEMPDGSKCYTENCERHKEKSSQTNNSDIKYAHDDNSRASSRSEKERSGGAVQRAGQASSNSEQGGDEEAGRQHRPRIFDHETTSRSIEESARAYGFEEADIKKYLIYPATAQLQAIEKAAHDGVHLEAVITRPEFGELIIDCGKPGKTEAKRNREQKAENEKAAKEGRERKIISSGGNGAIHAMEGRHHVNPFDIAEAIIEGKVSQDTNHAIRINLETEKIKVTLEREIKQGSKKISKARAKLHTASKI